MNTHPLRDAHSGDACQCMECRMIRLNQQTKRSILLPKENSVSDGDEFKIKLAELINTYGLEGGSDTPDYVLADYLIVCLTAFNVATKERKSWYS